MTQEELNIRFHPESRLVESGRVGALTAIKQARNMIYDQNRSREIDRVIVAGVDSLLNAQTLKVYEARERLLSSQNSNGFIPGEAASAVVVERPRASGAQLFCLGIGFGIESATIDSEKPLRADGLTTAIRESLKDAAVMMADIDYRVADVSGEQYWFKEAALSLSRVLRVHKEGFDIFHPADCIGEVGAAIGGIIMGSMMQAMTKGYAPGTTALHHYSNNDGQRAAAIFTIEKG
jgi:3-oxoacyl-[acyl-carrier-protein] synthase-1